jgi:hypothetical protein
MILESNQNHATAKNTEVVNALPASMGMGGGYVPMVVEPIYAVDMGGGKPSSVFYENISPTLCTTHYGEPVVTEPIVYSFIPRESQKTRSIGFAPNIAPTLNADGNCAVVEPIVVRDEMTIKVDANGKVFALRGRDHKSVQCVVTEDEDVVRG